MRWTRRAVSILQHEQIRNNIPHLWRRELVTRHDASSGERLRIPEMFLHPLLRAAALEAIQRGTELHAHSVDHVAGAALVLLISQRALDGEVRSRLQGFGVPRIELEQKCSQSVQLRVA